MRNLDVTHIKQQFPGLILQYSKHIVIVLLAAISPLLGYWANNLGQVRPTVVIRPLLIILLFTWGIFNLFLLILRSIQKTTLITFLLVTLFFSFGNNVILLSKIDLFGITIKSSYLLVIYILLFLTGTLFVFRIKSIPKIVFNYLLSYTVIISVIHIARVSFFEYKVSASIKSSSEMVTTSYSSDNLPDVFYIVLDAYSRNDVLQEIYGFDNSEFLKDLQSRGFYIPVCANSNYDFTINTISSVMNMDYLDTFGVQNKDLLRESPQQIALILDNKVRHVFADRGYQFVSTRGFSAFNDIQNADVYLNYYTSQGQKDELANRMFVNLFFDTILARRRPTANPMPGIAAPDTENPIPNLIEPKVVNSGTSIKIGNNINLEYEGNLFWFHQTNYVFDSLAILPEKPGNFLVYAHINSPHVPYVYNQDGSFRYPLDTKDEKILYQDTLVYLNKRVLTLVDTLIERSKVPPIIIIQADHGTKYFPFGIDKHKILSAYYLPGNISLQPYSTITPVNNFRLIIHNYFDSSEELLPDILFVNSGNEYEAVPSSCDVQ